MGGFIGGVCGRREGEGGLTAAAVGDDGIGHDFVSGLA